MAANRSHAGKFATLAVRDERAAKDKPGRQRGSPDLPQAFPCEKVVNGTSSPSFINPCMAVSTPRVCLLHTRRNYPDHSLLKPQGLCKHGIRDGAVGNVSAALEETPLAEGWISARSVTAFSSTPSEPPCKAGSGSPGSLLRRSGNPFPSPSTAQDPSRTTHRSPLARGNRAAKVRDKKKRYPYPRSR